MRLLLIAVLNIPVVLGLFFTMARDLLLKGLVQNQSVNTYSSAVAERFDA